MKFLIIEDDFISRNLLGKLLKKYVDALSGILNFKSEEKRGTKFEVILPIVIKGIEK